MFQIKGLMLCLTVLLLAITLNAQTEDWLWAHGVGGTGIDMTQAIATDTEGNSYVTGVFSRSVYFGSIVLSTLNTNGNTSFIAKISETGNWLWAKKLENIDDIGVTSYDIAVDDNGYAYLTGTYGGYLIVGSTTLYSMGNQDVFVAKIDSQGNWLWANNVGARGTQECRGIATDNNNNVYITGSYAYPYGLTIGNTQLITSGWSNEIFVAKMDTNGNWLWAKRSGGTCEVQGRSITVDSNFDVFLSGNKSTGGTATFGSSSVANNNPNFIAKMDSTGNWIWAIGSYGNATIPLNSFINNSGTSQIFVTGSFNGTITFGNTSLTSSGSCDVYVAKLDSNGNWLWAKKCGSSGEDQSFGIGVDSNSSVYLTGYYSGTANFGSFSTTSSGVYDAFVAKLDNNGDWLGIKSAGGSLADYATDLSIDANNNVYVTGYFNGSSTFGNNTIIPNGEWDFFVAKFGFPRIEAGFTADVISGVEPLPVQFTDQSLYEGGLIDSWHWSFGDGSFSSVQDPIHTYLHEGVYTVSLTVTNVYDSTDTLVSVDYIHVLPSIPEITLSPRSSIDFGVTILGMQSSRDLWIRNTGSATLRVESLAFRLLDTPFEVLGLTLPFNITAGDSAIVHLRFTPALAGAVIDSLFVFNNSVNFPRAAIRLNGTGQYVPPLQPGNVNIVMNGANAMINWASVTQTIMGTPIVPDYYLVFTSSPYPDGAFVFLSATTGLQYTHNLVGLFSKSTFYKIIAYKHYGRNLQGIETLGLAEGMTEDEVLRRLNDIR